MPGCLSSLFVLLLGACVAFAKETIECSLYEYPDINLTLSSCWTSPVEEKDGHMFRDQLYVWNRKLGPILDFVHHQMIHHCEVLGQCNSQSLPNKLKIHDIERKVLLEFSEKLKNILNEDGTLDQFEANCTGFDKISYNIFYEKGAGLSVEGDFDMSEEVNHKAHLFYSSQTGLQMEVSVSIPKREL